MDVVKLFLQKGADVNARGEDGRTALMLAAGNGRLEVVRLLLRRGADVNARSKDGSTALMEAAAKYYGQDEPAPSLGELIRDWLPGRFTGPLSRLRTQNRDPEVVKYLLENGADVNAQTADGWTALKRAQKGGTSEIVAVLRAHRAKE